MKASRSTSALSFDARNVTAICHPHTCLPFLALLVHDGRASWLALISRAERGISGFVASVGESSVYGRVGWAIVAYCGSCVELRIRYVAWSSLGKSAVAWCTRRIGNSENVAEDVLLEQGHCDDLVTRTLLPGHGGRTGTLFVTEELKPSNAEAYVTHQGLDECLRGRAFKIASALFCCVSICAKTI